MNLKKEVDFIIFFAHAGLEHYDVPLVEWRERYKRLCDLGVDAVVATHPHVPQGYEKYNNKYIFYSLGNFYFSEHSAIDKKEYVYSIILDFELGRDLKYEIVFHVRQELMLKRISENESPISLKVLNKKLAKQIFFPNKNQIQRELLLLHLTRNETYRYVTQKALEFKVNNYLDNLN